jgi:hypothetical protein
MSAALALLAMPSGEARRTDNPLYVNQAGRDRTGFASMPVNGRFLHGPGRKFYTFQIYTFLFIAGATGKGGNPMLLLEGIFQHATF